jgi:hypothetical protein
VYLTWANLLFLAFFSFNEINNLRAFNATFSSIPTAPTNIFLMDGHLTKTCGARKGQIRSMIRFCVFFSAARVTTGHAEVNHSIRVIRDVVPLGHFDGGINMTGLRNTGNILPKCGDLIITIDRISSGEL